ncbi:MAG: molybdopterin molybdotransferase MoeA [Chloroflexi bacterium]|nr:molybdopterin molybdotransferase MoeA [Chloroflexota bacterium]
MTKSDSPFFNLVPPEEARQLLLSRIPAISDVERLPAGQAMGRVLAADVISPQDLPTFRRSTVDGYAVQAADTFGASDSLPAYLQVVGEIPMGQAAQIDIGKGQTAEVHTGGMLPDSADAVVMIENTQPAGEHEIEVRRAAAPKENVIDVGEDISSGTPILRQGHILREQDIGGLLALGIVEVDVVRKPRLAVFSTGDEIIDPAQSPQIGQIRDINSTTVAALAAKAGAQADRLGILPDDFDTIYERVKAAYDEGYDMLVLSAGSSVSVRDVTAQVFDQLGEPGVLVHGIATKPGKPTIMGLAGRVPLMGLPGNPVSAFVQFVMNGQPILYTLQGTLPPRRLRTQARLSVNLASVAGREDYVPARLSDDPAGLIAEPIFFKSNLIFKLVEAEGLIRVPLNKTGLEAGDWAEVILF